MAQETNNEPELVTHFCKEKETERTITLQRNWLGKDYKGDCKMRPLWKDEIELHKIPGYGCCKPTIFTKECLYCGEFFE